MTADTPFPAPSVNLDAAAQRLERAVAALEAKLRFGGPRDDLFEADRARLAAQLDASRARERALEAVAAEASAALGQAAAEVRAAMKAGVRTQ